MKKTRSLLLIRIASVVFTVSVLTLAWMDYFNTGNKLLKFIVLLILATALAVFSVIYNPESRRSYGLYGIVILVLILFWILMR